MAIVTPRNPINSFKRLFSVGVRTRTQFSSLWGKVLVAGWGARALTRGSHLEECEQQHDYTKDDALDYDTDQNGGHRNVKFPGAQHVDEFRQRLHRGASD